MARGFRIGYPEETTAWKVLEFEYEELGNIHTLQDMSDFLRMVRVYEALSWRTTLGEFRRRYGNVQGAWLCPGIMDALLYYGKYYGEDPLILEYSYDPGNVVINLGADGFFVLDPHFVRERGVDPLEPLKRDVARILYKKLW